MRNQIGIEKNHPYVFVVNDVIKNMKVEPVANKESKSYKDMEKFGINMEMPVVAMHVGDLTTTVLRGGEILANAKELGIKEVWCMVVDFDFESIETTSFEENAEEVEEKTEEAKPVLPGRVDVQEVTIYKGSKNKGFKTERGAKAAKTRLSKQDKYQGYDLRVTKRDGVYVVVIKETEEKK